MPTMGTSSGLGRIWRWLLVGAGGLVGLLLVAVAVVYLWPLEAKSLQTTHPQSLSYDQAVQLANGLRQSDATEGVRPECLTTLYTHGQKTSHAVVLFHGVGECPQQMDGLAHYFYDRGYNVFLARDPFYGLPDNKQHGRATAQQYVAMADQAANIAGGLGDEVGAAGLSGGGVLATWVAEYRPDVIRRLLVLSPFYAPSSQQLPVWQRRILDVLYGYGILPDQFSTPDAGALSYHALGQFERIVANFEPQAVRARLISVASVVAPGDTAIDHKLARQVPEQLARASQAVFHYYETPVEWKLGHDIVKAGYNPDLNGHSADVYPIYFDLYEGRGR